MCDSSDDVFSAKFHKQHRVVVAVEVLYLTRENRCLVLGSDFYIIMYTNIERPADEGTLTAVSWRFVCRKLLVS